jgi:AcrR family transcriptional regulator
MSPRRPGAVPDTDTDAVRRHLVECCRRVLARRRTTDVTVREIAAEAGVATGLLYNHFDDKDDLLVAAILEHQPAFEGAALRGKAGTGSVAGNLEAYARDSFAVMRELLPLMVTLRPAVLERLTAAVHAGGTNPHDAARRSVAAYLRAEQRRGRVQPDADVDAVALLLTGALHELALFGPHGPKTGTADALVTRIVATVMCALNPRRTEQLL